MNELLIKADPVPLRVDDDGAIRVGGTRVTLDTLVAAYRNGATPEEIAEQYPALRLDDVYSAIGYVLRHGQQVGEYLRKRLVAAEQVEEQNEARWPSQGIRDRLMARRNGQGS
jgi:uncharacterized protein (DUF433 family)